MKNKIRIAFIGCGNMARAIIASMNNISVKAAFKSNREELVITASDCDESKLVAVRGLCAVTKSNAEAAASSDYVFLSVKPQDVENALVGVQLSQKTVISIMAGVSIDTLKKLTGSNRVVRVMPNMNARVGESINAYCTQGLDEEGMRVVQALLGSFGVGLEISESEMPDITGLSGSGPAFVFMTLKAFYDEAVARGFDQDTAKRIAVQTVIGSALTAEKSNEDFDALVSSVCSKGGTTERGVEYLTECGYESVLRGAIDKATERAKEMSK